MHASLAGDKPAGRVSVPSGGAVERSASLAAPRGRRASPRRPRRRGPL